MSSIELVIKIPEENYKKDNLIHFFGCYSEKLDEVIKNGTPIPENHGRIVDLDTVTVEEDTDKGVLWLDAPTILEASYGK